TGPEPPLGVGPEQQGEGDDPRSRRHHVAGVDAVIRRQRHEELALPHLTDDEEHPGDEERRRQGDPDGADRHAVETTRSLAPVTAVSRRPRRPAAMTNELIQAATTPARYT